jgi:hypothetical protein
MSEGLKDLMLTLIAKIDRVDDRVSRIDQGLVLLAETLGSVCTRLAALEEEIDDLFAEDDVTEEGGT